MFLYSALTLRQDRQETVGTPFDVALSDGNNPPAHSTQSFGTHAITSDIPLNLRPPIRLVGLRCLRLVAHVPVPEAAMHEHGQPAALKNQIWVSGKALFMQAIPVSFSVYRSSYPHLWHSVLASNGSHIPASRRGWLNTRAHVFDCAVAPYPGQATTHPRIGKSAPATSLLDLPPNPATISARHPRPIEGRGGANLAACYLLLSKGGDGMPRASPSRADKKSGRGGKRSGASRSRRAMQLSTCQMSTIMTI